MQQPSNQTRRFLTSLYLCCLVIAVVCPGAYAQNQIDSIIDSINLGEEKSEQAHQLGGNSSESFQGAVNSPARRLLPPSGEKWLGNKITFRLKVDAKEQNYFTAKFWGSELTGEESRLMLYVDGLQIGQRHLGEVDPLDILASSPRYPNRFFYKTLPLPLHLTSGKKEVTFAIQGEGPVNGYSRDFAGYQRALTKPSRGIYRCYTHNQPYLRVDDKEKQGEAAKEYPVRPGPGPEVLEASKARVNKHLSNIIHQENRNLGGENILVLARACFIPWTTAYHNRDALNQLVRGIDQEYLKYAEDNEVFRSQWHGAGDMGEAISLLGKVSLKKYLDRPIEGTDIQRRSAWTEMLVGSRDWQVRHRRLYSNQAMTVDLGMYRCNRGIAVLDPKRAWPEKMAIKILHEASGILPYSGPHKEKAGRPSWPLGKRFKQTTEMGLSRELGYVGAYGELIVPIIRDMYGASKPRPGGEGDPKLKEQLLRVAKARAVFRYPTPDKEGFRAMRMETVIGWRDWHYPGRVTYDQMPCDDGCPGDTAGELMDPELIGYARQMIDDNQFFAAIDEQNNRRGVNVFKALMRAPGNYEKIKNYRGELGKLPMAKGSPDFVFADTGDGVVALKHGDDILFTSLYWRARFGINNLARVHFLTPLFQHDATVAIQTVFDGSGQKYEIRNRANMAFTNRYEEEYQQQGIKYGMANQFYPIARIPGFVTDFKPGKENLYAGKGDQYLLVFGDYCIAMNCSSKKFSFPVPKEFIGAKVLSGESTTEVKSKYRLQSKETLVLFKG